DCASVSLRPAALPLCRRIDTARRAVRGPVARPRPALRGRPPLPPLRLLSEERRRKAFARDRLQRWRGPAGDAILRCRPADPGERLSVRELACAAALFAQDGG